jgi:hypothetical protein
LKSIIRSRQLADLCMQRLHIDGRLRRAIAAPETKNVRSPALEQRFPRGERSIALDGGKCHLRLEGRCVVPAGSSAHDLS